MIDVDTFEKRTGIRFTRNHTGKMRGMWSLYTVYAVTGKWVRIEHHIDVMEVTAAMRRLKDSDMGLVIRYERA